MTLPDQRFPAECRLRRPAEFDEVFRRRRSAADALIVVYARENGLEHTRLGLSVSRKVGGAVVRNRWKRLIREAFRLSRAKLPTGLDLVVIPRAGAAPSLAALCESLPVLANRVARTLRRAAD
ncbi:MAG: ribonuclease P protein component [Planctomycetes bacterium]|nr:ribonuclease P protein component [Planctomycetota bacterium]